MMPCCAFCDVSIGGLQQLQDNIFDVLANVARFGEGGGIDDSKRHIEHARKRLSEKSLAGAGGPDEQNVGLRQFDIAGLAIQENPLVVVINGDGKLLFGFVLADDVPIEKGFDLRRTRQAAIRGRACSRFSSSRICWQTPTHSLQM